MRVAINEMHCQGHTMCALSAPELFHFDEDGHAYVESPDVPAGLETKVRNAQANCPERAITVED
ncbi:ferredoxin [Rhodococcus rhodochrous]|uniref:Ferredoxin n=1 Tax=Rhodococcus rhodochrous TaxID=1829 RepID=A0AA46X1H2_RHORH|nr:ferredoxin [Rhodococcus rhodochrous]MCB8913751.1 ferredoxin [Rhodococcus rhodochrous]UZF48315.1 ferredoxin [Rhodococcus rhodochrous]